MLFFVFPESDFFQGALLCIDEDSEAVIKMIIKVRNPALRHVSRVTLDWLFDRINLDDKIRIRYVNSRNQHAAISTKGHFTRDEWNHILQMVNMSLFSFKNCSEPTAKQNNVTTKKEFFPNRSQ